MSQAGRTSSERSHELYRELIEFIQMDVQGERVRVNRRIFSVFFWCFLLPAITAAAALILVKFDLLPLRTRGYLDWMVLIFPITYSLYILGSEVLAPLPSTFRRGGTSNVLAQSLKDMQWRERVCAAMLKSVKASPDEWRWLVESLRIDLQSIQDRTRYLTALAGAVFFLLMEGIDALGGDPAVEPPVTWTKHPIMGWVESTGGSDMSQFVGLSLFLLLLYLSGNQTYHSLKRYLACAELNLIDLVHPKNRGMQ